MMASTKERHLIALLHPETEDELSLSTLTRELMRLGDRYKNDAVMVSVVEHLGAALIKLSGDGQTGRIDPLMLQKQVRDTVRRAGGNADEL